MPTPKTARIQMKIKPYLKEQIVSEGKRVDKHITELLLESWELYKKKHLKKLST